MKNANYVNMAILKQKMKNVYIVEVKDMEVLVVMNVDMNLMKMEMKKIILFVKIVFQLIFILITIIIASTNIITIIIFLILLIILKENALIILRQICAFNINL